MTNVSSARGIPKDQTITNTPVKIQIIENTPDFHNIPGALYYNSSAESLIFQIKKAARGRPIEELSIIGHAGRTGIGPISEEIFRNPSRHQYQLAVLKELKPSDFAPNAVVKLDGCFVGESRFLLKELSKLWKVRVQASPDYQKHAFYTNESIVQPNITTRAERYGNDGTTNDIEKEPFRGFEGTIVQASPSSAGKIDLLVDKNERTKDKCYQSDLYRSQTQDTTCNGISDVDVALSNIDKDLQKELLEREPILAPVKEAAKFLGQMSLSIGGGMGGTALGAFLGTLVCPGIGTAIGAALFGALGSGGAKAVSQQVYDGKVNWKEVFADAALGGISGGTSGWVQGIKQLPKIMAAMKGGKEVLGSKFAFSKTGEFITQASRLINADNMHKQWIMNALHRGVVNTGQGLTYKMLAGEQDLFNWQSMASDVVLGEFIHHGAKIIRPEINQGRHSSRKEVEKGTMFENKESIYGDEQNYFHRIINYAEYTTPIEMQRNKEYSFTDRPASSLNDISFIKIQERSKKITPLSENEIREVRASILDSDKDIEVFGHPWLALVRAKYYRAEDGIKTKYSQIKHSIEMKLPAFKELKRKMVEPPEYSRKDSLKVSKAFKNNPGELLNNVLARLSLNSNNFKEAIKDANLLLRHEFFEAIEVQNGSSIPSFNGQHWKDFMTGVLNSEVISTEQKIKVAQNINSTLIELLSSSSRKDNIKHLNTSEAHLQNLNFSDRQWLQYDILKNSKTNIENTVLARYSLALEPHALLPGDILHTRHNRIARIPLENGTYASLTFSSKGDIAFLEISGQPRQEIRLFEKQLISLGNHKYLENKHFDHPSSPDYLPPFDYVSQGRYKVITKIPNKTLPFKINAGEHYIDIGNNEKIILDKHGEAFDYKVYTDDGYARNITYGKSLKDNHKLPIRDLEFLIYDSQTQDFRIVHEIPNKKEPYHYSYDRYHELGSNLNPVEPFVWKNIETRFNYKDSEVRLIPQEANGKILIQVNGQDHGYWSINPGQSSHIKVSEDLGLNFDPKTNKVTVIHREVLNPTNLKETYIDGNGILSYEIGGYEVNYEVIYHPNPDYEHAKANQVRLYGINNISAKEGVPKISIVRSDGSITNIDFTMENLISFHYRKEAILHPGDHLYLGGHLIKIDSFLPSINPFTNRKYQPNLFVKVADQEINLSVKEHNININNVSLKFKTIGEDKTFSLTSSYPFITVISPGKTPYSHTIAGSNSFNFHGIKDGDILQWSDADGNLLGNMKIIANNNGVEIKPLPKDQVPKAIIPNVRVSKQFDFDGKIINLNGVKMVGAKDTTLYLQSLSGSSESSKIFIIRQGERIPLFINPQGNLHIADTHLTPILYPNDKLEITDTKYKKLIDFNLII